MGMLRAPGTFRPLRSTTTLKLRLLHIATGSWAGVDMRIVDS